MKLTSWRNEIVRNINSILLAVALLASQIVMGVISVRALGLTTTILDNFNRANGAIGNTWSGYNSAFSIASNRLDVTSNGFDTYIFWSNTSFGADQEAFVTFSQVDMDGPEQSLFLKSQSNTSYGNGVIEVLYDANADLVQVWTFHPTNGWAQQGANIPVIFVNGDQFGAHALANGTLEIYKNGILLATRSLTSWSYYASGGYIGLWFADSSDALLDDFGGGTVSAAPTNPPTVTRTNTPILPSATFTATSVATLTSIPPTATNTPLLTTTPTSAQTFTPVPTQTDTPVPPTAAYTPTHTSTASLTPSRTATNTYTPTLTATMPAELIFKDGFESGNFSAWTTSVSDNGSLSASAAAALTGVVGLSANINDNTAIYVQDDLPTAERRYRARFYFDPNSITMSNGNAHYLLYGYTGTSTVVVRVELRRSSNTYQLRSALVNDSATWTTTNWFTISDAPHFVELDWRASSAAGANNGGLTFWIDGAQLANVTGTDNDTRRIDRARLGAVAGLDTGTRGTEYLDAFESRRTSYIGADQSLPTPTPTFTAIASSSPTPTVAPTNTVVSPTNTATATPGIIATSTITNTPVAGAYEPFENLLATWIVETDANGTGSAVTRSSTQNHAGTSSAAAFTTNSNSKAQVRDVIPSTWSSVQMDTSSFIWQRAYVYVPSATANALTGSEYLDLGGIYVSGNLSGYYLRLKASGALYASGPGSSGQAEFNLYSTFPLDQWVEVELGLWSRNSGDLDRAGCFIINGKFYGWFTNGASGTDYNRAAMGIVATNSADDLTVYVDDWYIYGTGTLPTGTDNRPTGTSFTLDYTRLAGENVGYHYTTWENGYTFDSNFGFSPATRVQSSIETSRMPDLSDGWSQIVVDWAGGITPPWPPDLMGQFFGPMVGFRKSVELEENLEIVPVYRSSTGSVDLVFESWTLGPIEYAAWQLPMDGSGHRIPGRGDIIRVKWQEVSATQLRVRVDYYDASAGTWTIDAIDHTRALNNVNGVNFLADTHRAVTNTIDSNDYTIKSQTIGTLLTFPNP